MKNKITFPIIAASLLIISGCATNEVRYQQPGAPPVVTTGINIQDYTAAANNAVNELLGSGKLDKVSNPPAVIFVSRIINNTSQQIDTDLLTKKITKALNESGKAQTTSTDPAAQGFQQETAFMSDQKTERLPDFTLSGKIIETIDRSGDTRLTTYTFQLSLNDTKTAYQVWEGDKEIGKISSRANVGW
jgi:penicillin-binding protein activator